MSWIAELKEKINIVDFMISDGLQLKSEGIDRYTALCPFHTEKTPSFKVSETFQNYKCFGCGEYGDVIQYYAKRNALDYYTAALMLAEKYGVKVDNKSKEFEKINTNKVLYSLNEDLEKFYKEQFNKLPSNHPAKLQITNRKLSINDKDFGYAPNNDSVIDYIKKKGYTIQQMQELGHINEKGNIQLKNRLIFFIRNYMGKTVGFTGRDLSGKDTSFKYVNSKASAIFNKKVALYNIDEAKMSAKEKKEIYIVEGQFDVIALKQNGYENVICISGTAFTKEMIREITRCITQEGRIIFMLDGDSAGQKALIKVFRENPEIQQQLYNVVLPNGMDPCDYMQDNKVLPESHFTVSYLYDLVKDKYTLDKPENKNAFIKTVENSILNYITDAQIKEIYYKNACSLIGIDVDKSKMKDNTDKVSKDNQDTSIIDELPASDKYFIASISFYILNYKNIDSKLDYKKYPKRYYDFINNINEIIENNKKFIIENFTQKKLAEIVTNLNTVVIEDKKQANIHYNTLLDYATNIVLQEIKDKKAINAMQQLLS